MACLLDLQGNSKVAINLFLSFLLYILFFFSFFRSLCIEFCCVAIGITGAVKLGSTDLTNGAWTMRPALVGELLKVFTKAVINIYICKHHTPHDLLKLI